MVNYKEGALAPVEGKYGIFSHVDIPSLLACKLGISSGISMLVGANLWDGVFFVHNGD